MTEQDIQNALYQSYCDSRRLITPNCGLYAWVSDLITVTATGMVYEYEIKISVADFKRDSKKFRHEKLTSMSIGDPGLPIKPNYFYYVVPECIAGKIEVPGYAGLVLMQQQNERTQVMLTQKQAPRLHRFPITQKQTEFLQRGLMLRYWQGRIK